MMSLRAINYSLSAMTKFLYNEIIAGPDRYSEHLRRTPAFSINIFKKHYVIRSFYIGLYLTRHWKRIRLGRRSGLWDFKDGRQRLASVLGQSC